MSKLDKRAYVLRCLALQPQLFIPTDPTIPGQAHELSALMEKFCLEIDTCRKAGFEDAKWFFARIIIKSHSCTCSTQIVNDRGVRKRACKYSTARHGILRWGGGRWAITSFKAKIKHLGRGCDKDVDTDRGRDNAPSQPSATALPPPIKSKDCMTEKSPVLALFTLVCFAGRSI